MADHHSIMRTRIEVASFYRRNGAYMVSMSPEVPGWDDLTPHDIFDCAGSLKTARTAATDMANGLGCEGPYRVTKDDKLWRCFGYAFVDVYWDDES